MKVVKFHTMRIFVSLIFTIVIFSSLVLIVIHTNRYPNHRKTYEEVQHRLGEMMKYDKGSGCEMPHLDPFAPVMAKLGREIEKVVCEGENWVECYLSRCHPTNSIQNKMRDLICEYTDIINEGDEDHNLLGDPVTIHGNRSYVLAKSDFAKVSCTGVDMNSSLKTSWNGYLAGYRPIQLQKAPPPDSYNILFLVIDSVSRNQFMSRVSLSYEYLTEELNAIVLNRYNIVGDGTPAALMPILTSFDELELEDARTTPFNSRKINLSPFIFNILKDNGYRTAYYEDMPWINTFHYRFNGFASAPTDHYMRPFFLEEGPNVKVKHVDAKKRYCIGGESQMAFMLNYTSQLFDLPGKKYCLTFSCTYSHDNDSNISALDVDLFHFLKRFKDDGKLEDTVLFVMSDHGPRFAAYRETYQGKVEERLPFVSIFLPEKFKKARPEAFEHLRKNSEVLTTPFDLHATVLDTLDLLQYRNDFVVSGSDYERGMSLLRLIPEDRSCAEAGVMPHWCACLKWHNVSAYEPIYTKAANALRDYINNLTEEKRDMCALRALKSIEWVQRRSPNRNMLGFNPVYPRDSFLGKYMKNKHVKPENEYIQAKIILDPSRAVFEGSMQFIVKDDFLLLFERDISRINSYGDEPSCISSTHPHLNKYCYCLE